MKGERVRREPGRVRCPARVLAGAWALGMAIGVGWSGIPLRAADSVVRPLPSAFESEVIEVAGTVEVRGVGENPWRPAVTGQVMRPGDRLRTGDASRAAVRLSDRSILRLGERTLLEIQTPRGSERRRFGLLEGLLFLFNRERPADVEFETPVATGAIRGTEFVLEADAGNGVTRLALLDGRVELTAAGGSVDLASGERVTVAPGGVPLKSPLLEASSVVQWALYYPAVIDPDDLGLTEADRRVLGASIEAYRAGDLLAARAAAGGVPAVDEAGERYLAALDLAVGRVSMAEERLGRLDAGAPTVVALREIMALVRGSAEGDRVEWGETGTASGWLARSYSLQGRFRLREALSAAEHALRLAPGFGFAAVRVAELRLALGERDAALEALERGLTLSPRLAHGHALRGFVRLERGEVAASLLDFDHAIGLDAAYGQAWLGRGLAQARLGRRDEALGSFQAAAALEPRRALARSYLGKAFGQAREPTLAAKEFRLAKELDPGDPTAWLYSALESWQEQRPNRAVADLERSVALNDNRRLFRSRLRLDQDLAVRAANLAAVYRDAGLPETGLRSAARAVSEDYSGFSGHLFLAQSLRALEDPDRFDLRYETARESELLVANLLAPPGGANLSQLVSQQEHLQFLDPRPFGASSFTRYGSDGEWRQEASFFGSSGGFAYALDVAYETRNGEGAAEGRERRDVSLQLKQRIGPRDDLYLQAGIADASAGDVARHRDPADAKAGFRVEEEQVPNLHLGWHREWSAANHTLLLLSRLTDDLTLTDPDPGVLFLRQAGGGTTGALRAPFFDLAYAGRFTLLSAELQHVWQSDHHAIVVGARGQSGEIEPEAVLRRSVTGIVTDQGLSEPLRRVNAYIQHHWHIAGPLRLVGGLGYDRLTHPVNTEIPPLTEGHETRDLVAPRVGLLYEPWRDGLLRAGWSRSLGGMYFDQSVRLEPAQVAGFNQAFRSLLPESVAGLVPGSRFETLAAGFDQSFLSRTFAGLELELLRSDGDRVVGVLTNALPLPIPDSPSSTSQSLEYQERTLGFYLVQLLGDGFAGGVRYRVSEARLEGRFPGIARGVPGLDGLEQDESALLQQLSVSLNYQHASGVFARWESTWIRQENDGYTPALGADEFWRHDAWIGYRWPRRRAELRAGILNLGDTDHRLNPLNLMPAFPRERMAVVSLRLNY